MAISITHPFVSLKGDGGDATLVKPSHWNAAHTTSMATGNILGRMTAGAGSFEELPTTAYMIAALNSADKAALVAALGIGVFDTGDVKFSIDSAAAAGWISYSGEGTISKAGAGGTVRAGADCLPLWIIIYIGITDAFCPVSGGRTGSDVTSATNDFNAGKTMALPRFSGRAIIGAGSGSGLTGRAGGAYGGEETHLLTTPEIPSHTHANSLNDPGHLHGGIPAFAGAGGAGSFNAVSGTVNSGGSFTGVTITNAAAGGGGAHNNMQPHVAMWVKVKL